MQQVIIYLPQKMKEQAGTDLRRDLTTNDKSKTGSPVADRSQKTIPVWNITVPFLLLQKAGFEKDLLWTGSDDGLINVSKDGGKNWENVTPKDCPKWMMWNCVETDPFKKGSSLFCGHKI